MPELATEALPVQPEPTVIPTPPPTARANPRLQGAAERTGNALDKLAEARVKENQERADAKTKAAPDAKPTPEAPKQAVETPKVPKEGSDTTPPAQNAPTNALEGLAKAMEGSHDSKPVEVSPDEVNAEGEALEKDPHLPAKTAKTIQKYRTVTKTLASELERAKKELETERQTKANQPPTKAELTPEDKQLIEEARMYRIRQDAERDPEVKTKFDAPIGTYNDNINAILVSEGAPGELMERIKKAGGFVRFSEQSPEHAQQIHDAITKANWTKGRQLDANINNIVGLQTQKTQHLKEIAANADKFFEKKQHETKAQEEQRKQRETQEAQELEGWVGGVVAKHPVFGKIEIPANATPEQKKNLEGSIKAQTQLQDAMRAIYKGDRHWQSQMIIQALDGIFSKAEMGQKLAAKDAEIQKLQEQLKNITNSAPTPPAQRVTSRRDEPTPEPTNQPVRRPQDVRRGASSAEQSLDSMVENLVKGRANNQ